MATTWRNVVLAVLFLCIFLVTFYYGRGQQKETAASVPCGPCGGSSQS